jgi:type VI secretion system protein VasD
VLAPLLWGAVLVRCVHAEPVAAGEPTPVELTVVGGAELNPNSAGRASPVVMRIFDLTAAPLFAAAEFQALFDQPADVLKDSLVAQEEFVVRPGDIQTHNRLVQPQVRLLGVVAAFRDLEHGVWRLSVPITVGRRNFLIIDLDRNTIRVETVDSGHP